MPLYALGLNHTTAPVKIRERIAFQLDMLAPALRDLIGRPKVQEAAILSTCNRTEVYFHAAEPAPVVKWHDADLLDSERYTLEAWQTRPLWEKVTDWFWSLFRSQL